MPFSNKRDTALPPDAPAEISTWAEWVEYCEDSGRDPEAHFPKPKRPSREELLARRNAAIAIAPVGVFVNCHEDSCGNKTDPAWIREKAFDVGGGFKAWMRDGWTYRIHPDGRIERIGGYESF